jgi:hypothetical protein
MMSSFIDDGEVIDQKAWSHHNILVKRVCDQFCFETSK